MPLSDREQQILAQIEEHLYEEDPDFARRTVGTERKVRDRARLGLAVFLAGLVALVAFFITGLIPLGVVAFASMVAGIILVVGSLRSFLTYRRHGRPGERVSQALDRFEKRLRNRYRRRL